MSENGNHCKQDHGDKIVLIAATPSAGIVTCKHCGWSAVVDVDGNMLEVSPSSCERCSFQHDWEKPLHDVPVEIMEELLSAVNSARLAMGFEPRLPGADDQLLASLPPSAQNGGAPINDLDEDEWDDEEGSLDDFGDFLNGLNIGGL